MNLLQKKFQLINNQINSGDFANAEIAIYKLLKKNQELPYCHYLYGIILENQYKFNEAIVHYEKATKLKENYYEAYYNMGNSFMKCKMAEKAIINFKQSIKYKPDFIEGYIGLGNSLKYLEKFKEAISIFRKVVKLKPNFSGGYITLGTALQDNGRFDEAIPYLKKFGRASKARVLECFYSLKEFTKYNNYLSEISKKDPTNIRAATISAFVSHQLDITNVHPFCKKPIDYISITNINSLLKPLKFIDFSREVSDFKALWESSGKVTIQAFKTHGNIFDYKTKCILKLKELILNQVEKYRKKFATREDCIITRWPRSFILYGWHVKYLRLGRQDKHIHPDAWISGGFYIKIPKNRMNNEGSIRFDLHGFDYPIFNKNKKIPSFEYLPKEGDLVLFPSSLFHNTIPCSSYEERHMIAFDIRPGY